MFNHTSILMRFVDDKYNELSPTIGKNCLFSVIVGVDFKRKIMNIKEKNVRATIWDTGTNLILWLGIAGQERFRTLTSSYYRGAHGIVLGRELLLLLIS